MRKALFLMSVFVGSLFFGACAALPTPLAATSTPQPTVVATGTIPGALFSFLPSNNRVKEAGGVFTIMQLKKGEWVELSGEGAILTPGNVEIGKGEACFIVTITGPTTSEYALSNIEAYSIVVTVQSYEYPDTPMSVFVDADERDLGSSKDCQGGIEKVEISFPE